MSIKFCGKKDVDLLARPDSQYFCFGYSMKEDRPNIKNGSYERYFSSVQTAEDCQ